MNLWTRLNSAPHEDISFSREKKVDFRGALVATWTDCFDCSYETQFWYCIKDDLFSLDSIKAKRRYEINRGNRNFTVKLINPIEHGGEIYRVYVESLKGYKGSPVPDSWEHFQELIRAWDNPACCLFGAFDNSSGRLCGYSDVWLRTPYLPISSLKTIPDYERNGINFALVHGIYQYFEEEIKEGAYLCDGARNVMHQTHFQDFLIKYFGFRRAYCHLHLAYRWYLKPAIALLFPIRKVFKNRVPQLYALLKMEAWSRGMQEE